MKREIKINETKLKIKSITWRKGDSKILVTDKKSLVYQIILFTGNTSDKGRYWKGLGISKKSGEIEVPEEIRNNYTDALVLEHSTIRYEKETYDFSSQYTILAWIGELCNKFIDTAEILCHVIKDNYVTKRFYESYGQKELNKFKNELSNMIKTTSGLNKEPWTGEFSKIYTRNRYNIVDFINDLIDAEVEIYTDAELIGSYKKISRSIKDGSTYVPGEWGKVIGKSGNKTRANLSLTYIKKVTVDVPENEFGETAGPRELNTIRNFCIVADGMLNMKRLGIKTNNKKLIRKLKSTKMFMCEMLYSNEYLLDLTKIPIISKTKAKYVNLNDLINSEILAKTLDIKLCYLIRMRYKLREKLKTLPVKIPKKVEDPGEVFLHNLGIYGDYFYPKTTEVDKLESTYNSVEIISKIEGLPVDPTTQVTEFINKGTCRNKTIKKLLSSLVISEDTINEQIDNTEVEKKLNSQTLREMKFNIIMSKNLRFNNEYLKPKLEDIKFRSEDLVVSWDIKTTKITV